jgi:hypothetical protein
MDWRKKTPPKRGCKEDGAGPCGRFAPEWNRIKSLCDPMMVISKTFITEDAGNLPRDCEKSVKNP